MLRRFGRILSSVLLGLSATSAAAQSGGPLAFDADIADWQLADFDGDRDNDFVVFTGYGATRSAVFVFQGDDGVFSERVAIKLPSDAIAFCLGAFTKTRGSDLALLSPTGVRILAISAERKVALAPEPHAVETLFRGSGFGAPALLHWPTDVDGDGFDDVHVPTDHGLTVLFGAGNGAFAATGASLPLGGERYAQTSAEGGVELVRSYPRAVFSNVAGSPLADVAWFDERGFSAFVQESPRRFAPAPIVFPLAWLSSGEASGVVEQTDVQLADVDADGAGDLILARMQTRDGQILDMTTTLVVLVNTRADPIFPRAPSTALKLKGVVGLGPTLVDVDADGKLDLVYGTYAQGLGDAVSRLFSRVPVSVHIHRGTGAARTPFPTAPDLSVKSAVDADDFERFGARTTLSAVNDFDGDGLVDFVEISRRKDGRTAAVRPGGMRGKKFDFAAEPRKSVELGDFDDLSCRTLRSGGPCAFIVRKKNVLIVVRVP